MLQIVLSMITGAVLALGIAWFVRKYKGQIQKIISKYLYWILGICFPLLTGLLIGALTHSTGEELGSWADWASAIGTVGAFIWGIVVITKQTNIQRAMSIENKRPRFSFDLTEVILKNDFILLPNRRMDSKIIQAGLDENEGVLFRISNISANPIYSLKIILYYDDITNIEKRKEIKEKKNGNEEDIKPQKQTYIIYGMPKERTVVLVPGKFIKKWQKIFIKFHSSANEIGYMRCKSGQSVEYYFVKNKNTAISTTGDDQMILSTDQVAKDFDEAFLGSHPSALFSKMDKTIKKN